MTETRLSTHAATERAFHDQRMVIADFNLAPFTIAWEVTRACAFACKHCRADAQHQRDPNGLSTEEGSQLIARLSEFGTLLQRPAHSDRAGVERRPYSV